MVILQYPENLPILLELLSKISVDLGHMIVPRHYCSQLEICLARSKTLLPLNANLKRFRVLYTVYLVMLLQCCFQERNLCLRTCSERISLLPHHSYRGYVLSANRTFGVFPSSHYIIGYW